MTDCRRQLTFSFYQHRQLVADFKGGAISCDAGLLTVRELDQKLGWLAEKPVPLRLPADEPLFAVPRDFVKICDRDLGVAGTRTR